jgi:hypothetical protein
VPVTPPAQICLFKFCNQRRVVHQVGTRNGIITSEGGLGWGSKRMGQECGTTWDQEEAVSKVWKGCPSRLGATLPSSLGWTGASSRGIAPNNIADRCHGLCDIAKGRETSSDWVLAVSQLEFVVSCFRIRYTIPFVPLRAIDQNLNT